MALSRTKRAPKQAKPEPETTTCEVAETPKVSYKRFNCKEESCMFDEYSMGLCHRHYKQSQGFKFDETKKLYVKSEKRNK